MKKYPKITQILLGAVKRSGHSVKSLSEVTGIPYPTFNRRLENPGGWRFYEWGTIKNYVDFTSEELRLIENNL